MTTLDHRPAPGAVARRRPVGVRTLWILAGFALLAVLMVASVALGSRVVGWHDILVGIRGHHETLDQAAVVKRVPRTLLAVIVGAALGLAGGVMQGVTRNPLADPGILGVNTGASLAVVTGIVVFDLSTPVSFVWVAIFGAGVTAVAVYVVGSLGRGGATTLKLALAGAATSAVLVSLTSAFVLPRSDLAGGVQSWLIGGVGGASFANIRQILPFLVVGFAICLLAAKPLNSLALGDELAAGLGERVALVRATAALGAVLLCGACTAVTGPIGFVGLIVPHACRLLIGLDHRWLLPYSALLGAVLLTAADVVGRVVARPQEIDVGIVTAFIGAPIFIVIVRRLKVRQL